MQLPTEETTPTVPKAIKWWTRCLLYALITIVVVYISLSIQFGYLPAKMQKRNSPKLILLYTPFFNQKDYISKKNMLNCEVTCDFTSDKKAIVEADAVIFHIRDFDGIPEYRPSNQVWILYNLESPHHTPHVLKSLDGQINWTVTYREDSDIAFRYDYAGYELLKGNKTRIKEKSLTSKTHAVAWLVSNCHTASHREDFIRELQKYISVDIYGSCGQYRCLPKMSDECYEKLARKYYFYLSFENSLCRDYVTEKFFRLLQYDIIPVVFGAANYSSLAPPNSFIDALTFPSPEGLANYLNFLAKNPDLYATYLSWKGLYRIRKEHFACALCKKLHKTHESSKVYHDLEAWWFEGGHCKSWNSTLTKIES